MKYSELIVITLLEPAIMMCIVNIMNMPTFG